MLYLSHHSGPINRSIFTLPRTTIVEFEDAAAASKARHLQLKGNTPKSALLTTVTNIVHLHLLQEVPLETGKGVWTRFKWELISHRL